MKAYTACAGISYSIRICFFAILTSISCISDATSEGKNGQVDLSVSFGSVQENGPVVVSFENLTDPTVTSYVVGKKNGSSINYKFKSIPAGKYKIQAVLILSKPGCLSLEELNKKQDIPDAYPFTCLPFKGDMFGKVTADVEVKSGYSTPVVIQCTNQMK